MHDLLYKLLPMVFSLTLSQSIYLRINERYEITNKITPKLPVPQELKAVFCFCFAIVISLIVGVIGIYIFDIPITVYFVFSGILTGLGIGISNTISLEESTKL